MRIENKNYNALIDTGANLSLINSEIKDFPKIKLKDPIRFSTITNKDMINYEIGTVAPTEFNLPSNARARWKATPLIGRKYDFIIGMDILNFLNAQIDIEEKKIILNQRECSFLNDPFNFTQIHSLETTGLSLDRLSLDHLNAEEHREITKLLKLFNNLLFNEGDKLTNTTEIQHEIKTTTQQQINSKLYRYPPQHELEVRKQIKDMEEQGIIQKSHSRYSSPLIVVPKKLDNSGEKKYRLVIDYRKLNEVTIDDKYPLPNIDSILDKLGRAQYFTTLDLAKGYHQILVKTEDREKTAFVTPHGLYEFIRMPFGLKNAPATFQRLMNEILRDYINKTCVVYLDDILIFSTSLSEHIKAIQDIFKVLEYKNLKIQIDKCNFVKKETELRINVKDPTYIEAFEKLKQLISSHPILRYPNFEKEFTLTTDASNYAIGAFISQEGHPVCFASRTLNKHEQNYSATDKEFLAIMWSVNYFRPYLYGRKFKIVTDHQPIKYLHSKYRGKDMSPRHQRWLLKLGEYQFNIEYIKGKENRVADFLSRIENNEDVIKDKEEGENTSKAQSLQNLEDYECNVNIIDNLDDDVSMETVHSAEENLHDHFYIKDEIVNKYKTQIILTNNKIEELKRLHGKRIIFVSEYDFDRMSDIFRKCITKGKVGIFSEISERKYNTVQEKLIEMYSNDKQIEFIKCTIRAQDIETEVEAVKQISLYHVRESMHSGIQETYNQLKNKIYYPKLLELIQIVINQCETCQEIKYDRRPIKPKFFHTETPTNKGEIIHIDTYVMKSCHFLTVIDKFSKYGVAYSLNDRNHITIIEPLEDYFTKIGKPKKIVADNEFNVTRIKEFLSNEDIELHLTKPNSHTGNADIERFHNTISEKFRMLNKLNKGISVKQLIQKAIRNYNDRFHSTIKFTPYEVHNNKVNQDVVRRNLEQIKEKTIVKLNRSREEYTEQRTEGFIKNYKAVRHKEQPKYRKHKLDKVHPSNIKRPLKFTDMDHDDSNNTNDTTM